MNSEHGIRRWPEASRALAQEHCGCELRTLEVRFCSGLPAANIGATVASENYVAAVIRRTSYRS